MKLPQLVLAAACTLLQLSGCGGGSSSKPTPTQSSTPASSAPKSSEPVSSVSSSSPQPIALTIKGALAPSLHLANADIKAVAGDQIFTTNANSDRTYSLDILVSEKNKAIPIQMFAKGVGTGSFVELANILPSTIKLVDLAGNDKTVDSQEFFGTNFSTLTTAEYAQIKLLNLTLATDSERDNALLSLSEYDALKLATLIQDYSSRSTISLPEEKATTLELALDADLAETHISITYRRASELELRRDPIQTKMTMEVLSGKYFVKTGEQDRAYSLVFNADGTGELLADVNFMISTNTKGSVNSPFTWEQEDKVIKLSFTSLSLAKTQDVWLPIGEQCDTEITDFVDTCEIKLASMNIEIITDREQGKLFYVYPTFQSFRNGELISSDHGLYVRTGVLFKPQDNVTFTAEKIVNADWHIGNYSYRFTTATEGIRTNFLTDTQEQFVWSIVNGRLSINLNSTEIQPFQETKAGYRVLYFENTNTALAVISNRLMVKRQPLSLTENDWLARWVGIPVGKDNWYDDFNPNGDWSSGFFPRGNGRWFITGTSSINAKNENWQYDFDVLSIHDNIHYLRVCHGPAVIDTQWYGCFVAPYLKTNPASFAILGGGSFGGVFNELATGKYLKLTSNEYYEGVSENIEQKKVYQKVSATRLFIPETGSIWQLVSNSSSEVIFCEYQADSSCNTGTKRTLTPGLQVKLNITGNGTVYQKYLTQHGNIRTQTSEYVMLPKGHKQLLDLVPASGYSLSSESISGCGGKLAELIYHIPPLQSSCEINIAFTKIQ